jgi:hypothetical protein
MQVETKERDQYDSARENAKGWLASIEEMNERHAAAKEQACSGPDETEDTRREIEESVLSVQVRSGWYSPGRLQDAADEASPEEYEILLSTGGPALRIIGRLDAYCEPETAEMQMQDWYVPWTRYHAPESTLLDFARVFWYGD